MQKSVIIGTFALSCLLTMSANAQDNATTQNQIREQNRNQAQSLIPQQELSNSDKEFFNTAAMDNLAEIRQGEAASNLASDEKVRQFARQLVRDHEDAQGKLMDIASKIGVELPQQLNEESKQTLEELRSLDREKIDQAYLDEQVKDHEEAIKLFEDESQRGQNAELKQYAKTSLPVLKEHLEMAKATSEQIQQ